MRLRYADASWLLVLALLVWTLQWDPVSSALAVAAFCVSVAAHEFGHRIVARSLGVPPEHVAVPDARAEAQIAFAGLTGSACIAALFAGAAGIFAQDSLEYQALMYVAAVNALLAAVHCVPAYPLDGGRLLHALAIRATHDSGRAAQISLRVSTAAGAAAVVCAFTLLLSAQPRTGLWLALLAFFILRAVQSEYAQAGRDSLASVRCRDVVDPPAAGFQPDMTCIQAIDEMIHLGRGTVPVTVGKRLLGLLALDDFAKLSGNDPRYVYVSSIMTPASELQTLAPELSGAEALRQLSEAGRRQLPVVDEHGMLLGFVSRETLRGTEERAL